MNFILTCRDTVARHRSAGIRGTSDACSACGGRYAHREQPLRQLWLRRRCSAQQAAACRRPFLQTSAQCPGVCDSGHTAKLGVCSAAGIRPATVPGVSSSASTWSETASSSGSITSDSTRRTTGICMGSSCSTSSSRTAATTTTTTTWFPSSATRGAASVPSLSTTILFPSDSTAVYPSSSAITLPSQRRQYEP